MPKTGPGEEKRTLGFGYIDDFPIAVVWTQRGDRGHIISARKASRKERKLL